MRRLFFVLLASASLVESGTDVYADVLGQHFAADIELCEWLDRRWRREELQHGLALRSYEFFPDRSRVALALVMSRMPRRMVVKMALRPLDLPDRLQGALVHPVSRAMQWLFS